MIDHLERRRDAHVIHDDVRDRRPHPDVSGHASQEELRLMI